MPDLPLNTTAGASVLSDSRTSIHQQLLTLDFALGSRQIG